MRKYLAGIAIVLSIFTLSASPIRADEKEGTSITSKDASTTKVATGTVFIGDGRFSDLKSKIDIKDNDFFVTSTDVGLSWFKDTGKKLVTATMSSHTDITKWSIVIDMGSYDIGDAEGYVTEYTSLLSGDWKNYSVYLMSVNPVDESKYSGTDKLSNAKIEAFNTKIKSVPGIAKYVDSYSLVKAKLDAEGGSSLTDDSGFYFTKDIYTIIYDSSTKYIDATSIATESDRTEAQQAEDIKNSMTGSFGSESSIPGINKQQEWQNTEVQLPDGSDLTSQEKRALAQWGEDLNAKKDSSVVSFLRTAVSFVGILLVVYIVIMYIVYWVDRINVFFEFSLLSLITLGRLGVSSDPDISTYSGTGGGIKYVTHKDMAFIVVLGITAGMLIISGKLYYLLSMLVSVIEKVTSIF